MSTSQSNWIKQNKYLASASNFEDIVNLPLATHWLQLYATLIWVHLNALGYVHILYT